MNQRWCAALSFGLLGMMAAEAGEEVRKIPLEQIGSTTGQKGIKKMTAAMDGAGKYIEAYGKDLEQLLREGRRGPSVVLVSGKDLATAVATTRGRMGDGDSKKAAPDLVANPQDTFWIAAYFGTNGSSPPAFEVLAVEVKGKTVRITYKKGAAFTDDIHHYYAWAPLGKVLAGTYTLELLESKSKDVTLKRECKVSVK